MSEQIEDRGRNGQEEKTPGRRPDFLAYHVQDAPEGKGYWNRIGAAWEHKDGEGYELNLDAMPVDGRVTLRTLREERMAAYEEEEAKAPAREAARESSREPSRGRSRDRAR